MRLAGTGTVVNSRLRSNPFYARFLCRQRLPINVETPLVPAPPVRVSDHQSDFIEIKVFSPLST